jgi:hypothetical protein
MLSKTSIVIYGKDVVLLETRRLLLEGADFSCVTTAGIDEVVAALQPDGASLLILCSSLSDGEVKEVLSVVDTLAKPGLKKLILTKERKPDSHEGLVEVLQTPVPPHTFLTRVSDEVG